MVMKFKNIPTLKSMAKNSEMYEVSNEKTKIMLEPEGLFEADRIEGKT